MFLINPTDLTECLRLCLHVEVDHSALHARMECSWNVTEDKNGASSSEQQSIRMCDRLSAHKHSITATVNSRNHTFKALDAVIPEHTRLRPGPVDLCGES
jgi:hypothetical protein